ncbi:electron transfer flavoprotein subunit alpha/FixB family protein [Oceanobacillus rekensis]|uniref:electron transfer flavoprotein subunit alpha/FixB family protein n=1 Tax=Oceanobacillus rekensis TaxID=937927 RepID=UPI000B43062B|nr:electron transfer flavoprotein subunit alpha/FixB family protein [Oceanobacillus rekensis]
MSKKVLVLGEISNQKLRNVSFEAIGAARTIARDGEVLAVLLGNSVQAFADELIHYGADRVITVEHENLKHYTSDGYSQALLEIIDGENPEGIVFAHTALGKDLAPRIASKIDSGLVSDVTDIEVDGDNILFTRPIYSGKAFEKKIITDGISFVTIRPNNITAFEKSEARTGEIVPKQIEINNLRTIIKDIIQKKSEGVDLSEAKIVVAGGRGVKSKEGFDKLYEFADVLGAAVGASRGACDAGYCDYSLQIGQTGKVVTPDLYIAVGISGAIQHLAGMSNSKKIVAINKDADSNIFNVADYGIVGDLFEVLPKLTEEIRKIKVGV